MKAAYMAILAALGMSAFAAPFVTPAMTKRNGLTDEQYQLLWAQGKNPRISIDAARDWIFRSSRYQNVTNWLDICGKTNNFARLSYKLQGDNDILTETNRVITAENKELVVSNAVLEVDAKIAHKVEKAAKKARQKDAKNFEKWVKDTIKAREKSSKDMQEFYNTILEISSGVDK